MSLAFLFAFTHAGYVAAGWLAALLLVGGYAIATIRKGRRLSRVVPPEHRRWS